VDVAGAVLNDDQGIEAPQQHGVHVDEIDRQNAVGLGGQELLPGRPRPAGRGIDPSGMQDLVGLEYTTVAVTLWVPETLSPHATWAYS